MLSFNPEADHGVTVCCPLGAGASAGGVVPLRRGLWAVQAAARVHLVLDGERGLQNECMLSNNQQASTSKHAAMSATSTCLVCMFNALHAYCAWKLHALGATL
jgi:hypothetical protein